MRSGSLNKTKEMKTVLWHHWKIRFPDKGIYGACVMTYDALMLVEPKKLKLSEILSEG